MSFEQEVTDDTEDLPRTQVCDRTGRLSEYRCFCERQGASRLLI